MDGLRQKWTVQKTRSGRSSGMQVDGPKRSNGLSMLVADFTIGGKLGMSVTSQGEIRVRVK